MSTKLYRLDNRQELILTEEVGAGGEGRVCKVRGQPGLVAKIFRRPDPTRTKKLAAMLSKPPVIKGTQSFIAWPVALLGRRPGASEAAGYLMPAVRDAREIARYYNPSLRRQTSPYFNYRYLVSTAANVAIAVHALHECGYVIGDFNSSNVRVKDDTTVILIDTDSFQVTDKGEVYFCPVGTPEYTPPELIGGSLRNVVRTVAQDSFGLGVLFFQLLMEGQHPFGGKYLGPGEPPAIAQVAKSGIFPYGRRSTAHWQPAPLAPHIEILPNDLRNLFELCFVDGFANPKVRPNAQRWGETLRAFFDDLQPCTRGAQHFYRVGLRRCPWCARRKQLGGRDPFPSERRTARPATRRATRKPSRTRIAASPFHTMPTPWLEAEVRSTASVRRTRPSTPRPPSQKQSQNQATWITVLSPLPGRGTHFRAWPWLLASLVSFLGYAFYPQAEHRARVLFAELRSDARIARPLRACTNPESPSTCPEAYRVDANERVRLIAEKDGGWVKVQVPRVLEEAYVHRLDLTATTASNVPLSRLVSPTQTLAAKHPTTGKTVMRLASGVHLPLLGRNGNWACVAHPVRGVLAVRDRRLQKLPPPRVLKPEVPCPKHPRRLDARSWKPNAKLWRGPRRAVNACSRPLINAKCLAPEEARQFASGTRVQVLEKGANGWYRIRVAAGDESWVYGPYVVFTAPVDFEPWTVAKPRRQRAQAYVDATLERALYSIHTPRVVVDAGGKPPVFRILKPSGGEAFVPQRQMKVLYR